MTTAEALKYRNMRVIRGGLSPLRGRRRGRRTRTAAELVLERWVREEFNALGKRPSEAIQKICEGEQRPLAVFGRRIIEAKIAGCDPESIRRIARRVIEWVDLVLVHGPCAGQPSEPEQTITLYQSRSVA